MYIVRVVNGNRDRSQENFLGHEYFNKALNLSMCLLLYLLNKYTGWLYLTSENFWEEQEATAQMSKTLFNTQGQSFSSRVRIRGFMLHQYAYTYFGEHIFILQGFLENRL